MQGQNVSNATSVGAVTTGAYHKSAVNVKSNSKKQPIPIGQKKAEKNTQKQNSVEPKRPAPEGIKDVTVEANLTLFDIATQYHVSIKDVLKANPGLNPDKIREGQVLKMPYVSDKKWNAYIDSKEKFEKQESAKIEAQWKKEQAQALKQKTQLAQAKIQEANDLEYNEDYSFKVDAKSGNIILTLKKAKELGDIRSDFRLPGGHLREMNPSITEKYKPGSNYNIDTYIRSNDWDAAEANKGDVFIIDPNAFNPSKGFFGDLFD